MREYFCECEHPVFDSAAPDFDGSCRRCGRTVTMFRVATEQLDVEPHSVDVTRRQELFDRLSPTSELGSVDGRMVAGVALVVVTALLVVLFWKWLVGAGVMYGAYRHLTRGSRRRRPRSSVAQLVQAVGVAFAAWQSRKIPRRNGRPLRVSVPASVGRQHIDDDGIPY